MSTNAASSRPIPDAEVRAGHGTARFEWHGSAVLLVTLVGRLQTAFAPEIISALQAALSSTRGDVRVFWDVEGVTHYDTPIRTRVVSVLLEHRHHVHSCVLARLPLVRMGVSVAALVLRNVSWTTDRRGFEAQLEEAIVDEEIQRAV